MTEDTHPHPWTVPREDDDDGPPDVGDPRDMAVPSVRRGGMTVASGSDWAALVASLGDLKDDTPMRRATRDDYQHADAFAQAVEGAMRLDPRVAALRPGDEFEVEHRGRRTWARVTDSWRVARGRFVRGRTTLGMIVTTHEAHISEVRVELDDAVRESWARRCAQ